LQAEATLSLREVEARVRRLEVCGELAEMLCLGRSCLAFVIFDVAQPLVGFRSAFRVRSQQMQA
jgi:hypothetical protein